MDAQFVGRATLPLNPFRFIKFQLEQFCLSVLRRTKPEPDLFASIFHKNFVIGLTVVMASSAPVMGLDCDTYMDLTSGPVGLQVTAELADPIALDVLCTQLPIEPALPQLPHPGLSSALQVLASSSDFSSAPACKNKVPLDTASVRRSSRANKYDGFKTHHISDARPTKSKVKPRAAPTVKTTSLASAPAIPSTSTEVPPALPIDDIQRIGGQCGIPPEELTSGKLLADQQQDA